MKCSDNRAGWKGEPRYIVGPGIRFGGETSHAGDRSSGGRSSSRRTAMDVAAPAWMWAEHVRFWNTAWMNRGIDVRVFGNREEMPPG